MTDPRQLAADMQLDKDSRHFRSAVARLFRQAFEFAARHKADANDEMADREHLAKKEAEGRDG